MRKLKPEVDLGRFLSQLLEAFPAWVGSDFDPKGKSEGEVMRAIANRS